MNWRSSETCYQLFIDFVLNNECMSLSPYNTHTVLNKNRKKRENAMYQVTKSSKMSILVGIERKQSNASLAFAKKPHVRVSYSDSLPLLVFCAPHPGA